MHLSKLKGIPVLDKDAKDIGRVEDIDFDTKTGQISEVIISLKKGILSKNQIEIKYSDIATIGDYLILNIDLPQKSESVEVNKE